VKRFCIPPEHSAAFVQAMEDVLDVYHLPLDPTRPVVCFDETSKQLVKDIHEPLAARPGKPAQGKESAKPGKIAREDDQYVRCGTANIFLAVQPLTGIVVTQATERRTAFDCALFLRYLADEVYPDASKLLLVSDNLNTHTAASFYEAFAPDEARRLTTKFEMHHTPKHGSWLNIAECQLSVLSRQCLDQRIASLTQLQHILPAWQRSRKVSPTKWQFTTAAARIKLRRLYPITSNETRH
jgi:hypothetical protein